MAKYHLVFGGDFELSKLFKDKIFSSNKIRALLFNCNRELKERTDNYKVESWMDLVFRGDYEIFCVQGLSIIGKFEKNYNRGKYYLGLTVVYSNKRDSDKLIEIFKRTTAFKKIKEGSFSEEIIRNELNDSLNRISPNGKILLDKRYDSLFPIFYDSAKRELLWKIISSFEGASLPWDIIQKNVVGTSERRERVLISLAEDDAIFNKNYTIACGKCGNRIDQMTFNSEKGAINVVKKAGFVCTEDKCTSSKARIIPTFGLKEEIIKILRNGVWLEKLTDDIFKQTTEDTWPCRMHGNNELDNVILYKENKILVECKDTSFGQNNFYTLLAKADSLEADVIMIITTKKIDPSTVLKVIQQYEEQGDRSILIVESTNKDTITKKIESHLRELDKYYIKKEMNKKRVSRPYYLDRYRHHLPRPR